MADGEHHIAVDDGPAGDIVELRQRGHIAGAREHVVPCGPAVFDPDREQFAGRVGRHHIVAGHRGARAFENAGGFRDALMIPERAAVDLGQRVEMIVLRGHEDAAAIGVRRVHDGHAQIDFPILATRCRVEREDRTESGADENPAFIEGDAAAETLGGIDRHAGSKQSEPIESVVGAGRGEILVP